MKGKLVTYQGVLKYYEHVCLNNFILLFMCLSTALIIRNSYILAGISRKRSRLNLKGFQYQIWTSAKKIEKVVIKKDKF